MCSAPVYNDVVEEWQHQGQRRRKKKEKKAGDLPSFLRSSQSPERSRKDDLNAYLSGHGAVYGGPEWEAEWNSARFLPDLVTAHHSQVLLPFVKTSEKKLQRVKNHWWQCTFSAMTTGMTQPSVCESSRWVSDCIFHKYFLGKERDLDFVKRIWLSNIQMIWNCNLWRNLAFF